MNNTNTIISEGSSNPRDFAHISHMIIWHRRYDSPDKNEFDLDSFRKFMGAEKARNAAELCNLAKKKAVVLPIYMLDHSIISLSTEPFGDPWDSGFAGFIYELTADIREAKGLKRLKQSDIDEEIKNMKKEVQDYSEWLNGGEI